MSAAHTTVPRWRPLWAAAGAGIYPGSSGAAVALAFSRLYALVLVLAWSSLAVQVQLLIGERGLLPLRPLLRSLQEAPEVSLLMWPSLLRWPALASDGLLLAGTLAGVALGLTALLGWRPRLCFGLSTALYLSYATACRGFLGFQWDNLLLECGVLATLLPTDRPAPLVHLLFRLVVFKLYFESGLAKWQSGLGDWRDGSAMTFYYETAPLPTWLGFFAHNVPAGWHRLESHLVLLGELLLPFFLFGPRALRMTAALVLSAFQVVNLLTANYGFFCYLSLALHIFALDDDQVARPLDWLRSRLGSRLLPAPLPEPAPPSSVRRLLAWGGTALFVIISLLGALDRFGPRDPDWQQVIAPLERLYGPWRLVNTYQLFASVTRERIEPQIEIRRRGQGEAAWEPQHLRYKPGDPQRRPPFVAPHQPRVDFLLWFHGLSWQRRPEYLANLLAHVCHDPAAVASLFARPLPPRPEAVRVVYFDYRFTSVGEWRSTGRYWRPVLAGTTAEVSCDR